MPLRVNLANPLPQKMPPGKLVRHLSQLFADEFCTTGVSVFNHLKSGDPLVGEYVTTWLNSQGWKVSWYHVPVPGGAFAPNDHMQYTAISFGFVFDESCEEYLAWKLAHT